MLILGIETSCDETAAAVIFATPDNLQVRSNIVSSQIALHARWGGVVPNLAAREHLKNILPVLDACLKETGASFSQIDLIAATNGPGLIPALLIGTNTAKTLSYVWKKPLLGIHHIEGHIYANFINEIRVNPKSQIPNPKQIKNYKIKNSKIKFPILCLVVSGGHTQLVLMKKHLDYQIIGQTLDDAAGEAFDKVARILNLGYPGGPAIAAEAAKFNPPAGGQNSKFSINLPRPMVNKDNFNFSFSGLKTAVLYETKKHPELIKNKKYISALCREFQQAVIDVLISKTLKAAYKYKPRTILLAGGVSANWELRKQLEIAIKKAFPNVKYQIPGIKYSVDNAAMIAVAGYFRWQNMSAAQRKKSIDNWKNLETDANLKLRS